MASIVADDALILPHRANPRGWNFRERQDQSVSPSCRARLITSPTRRAPNAPPTRQRDKALRLIATKPDIGLVLADFAMPEMNGVELARAVHATRPTLPVILVTGYCDHDLLKEFGDSRILQKPYTEGDLVDKIAAALN